MILNQNYTHIDLAISKLVAVSLCCEWIVTSYFISLEGDPDCLFSSIPSGCGLYKLLFVVALTQADLEPLVFLLQSLWV